MCLHSFLALNELTLQERKVNLEQKKTLETGDGNNNKNDKFINYDKTSR